MKVLFLFIILFASHVYAEFNLMPNLNEPSRKLILKHLGLTSSSKNLSKPLPLGTDSGLEISLTTELINVNRIKAFIESKDDSILLYPRILIGKGISQSTDIFFHFVPYTATLGFSEFGGMFRYNFYRDEDSVFVPSIVLHANGSNFNNQLTTRNVGADLSFGLAWEHFSVFASGGFASSSGKFIGGPQGVTDSLAAEDESVDSIHFSVGGTAQFSKYLFAAAMDHYTAPVYTIKIGLLF